MANFHRPNLEGSFDMNSTGIRQGEEHSKYSGMSLPEGFSWTLATCLFLARSSPLT